mmetsp:Transcript_18496/g.28551  ORF Transcript_18496/g.28551 Transcript_18496/m.28551 type:complete len:222 (-) Transcript_18496:172-837(-)
MRLTPAKLFYTATYYCAVTAAASTTRGGTVTRRWIVSSSTTSSFIHHCHRTHKLPSSLVQHVRDQPFPHFSVTARNMSSSNNDNKVDEVEEAKKAAALYKDSDLDGAGPSTVFDKILSGEWSSDKVHEDDQCLAFRDINPQAPTHIVLIPKVRDGLTQLSKARDDQSPLLGHLLFVAQSIGKKECPQGFRIVINDGEHGSQSVYHLHLHIIGGRQLGWPPG